MKQIFRYIFVVVLLALVAPSCNMDFEWEGFGLNHNDSETNCIKLPVDDGSTVISVRAMSLRISIFLTIMISFLKYFLVIIPQTIPIFRSLWRGAESSSPTRVRQTAPVRLPTR